jgi:N-methylhydantoinase B
MGNLIKASAEINEQLFPHILRGRNYLTDSGGAGQWRGGCGSHFIKEVRTPTSVNQYVVNQRHTHPGIAGGADGSPDICHVGETFVETAVSGVLLDTGEQLDYRFGGGGGWGDPLDRDPQAVLDDVWDEYVSIDGAKRDYGVVITGDVQAMTLELDLAATDSERAARRTGGAAE